MKTLCAILSVSLMLGAMYMMFYVRDIEFNTADLPFVLGFGIMLMGIIFFLFTIIEERNEEISQLKEKMYNFLRR